MKHVYSIDGENYTEDSLHDTITQAAEDIEDLDLGSILRIYRAVPVTPSASKFLPDIIGEMRDHASHEGPEEVAGEWPDVTEAQQQELETQIADIVDAWATKHSQQPNLFSVEEVEVVRFEVKVLKPLKYEEV